MYDPAGSLVRGGSRVAGLSRPLRRLVAQNRVLFWRDSFHRTPAYYVRLQPPFMLESASGRRKVELTRMQEGEGCEVLAFEGVCEQGFRYRLEIKAQIRSGRGVQYTGMLRWVKEARSDSDYAVCYEMIIWR